MGLQKRGRTRGKSGWINYSWSNKNGVGTSFSTKLSKNITLNWFGKGPNRTTVNFGNGWKWVSTNKKRDPSTSTNTNDSGGLVVFLVCFAAMLWIGGLFTAAGWFGWLFGSLIYTACTAILVWLYTSDDKE